MMTESTDNLAEARASDGSEVCAPGEAPPQEPTAAESLPAESAEEATVEERQSAEPVAADNAAGDGDGPGQDEIGGEGEGQQCAEATGDGDPAAGDTPPVGGRVPQPPEHEPLEESSEVTVESVVEAVLFASNEPLTAERIVGVLETGSVKQVRRAVEHLNAEYERQGRPFRIEQIAGGYQMMTLPAYNPWIRKLLRVRTDTKLSPAALETLAIVAYKQPIIRADIEAIRGVACGEVLRNLMYKGLVKMVGRAEVLGRPMLYGTTKKFLDVFGLSSLKDLPKIEDMALPGNGGRAE